MTTVKELILQLKKCSNQNARIFVRDRTPATLRIARWVGDEEYYTIEARD